MSNVTRPYGGPRGQHTYSHQRCSLQNLSGDGLVASMQIDISNANSYRTVLRTLERTSALRRNLLSDHTSFLCPWPQSGESRFENVFPHFLSHWGATLQNSSRMRNALHSQVERNATGKCGLWNLNPNSLAVAGWLGDLFNPLSHSFLSSTGNLCSSTSL